MEKIKEMKDVEQITAAKQPKTAGEALDIMKEIISEGIPDIGEKVKKIQLARGAILETSTHIEKLFDELIIRATNSRDLPRYFRSKAKAVREIMLAIDPFEEKINKEFLDKLDKQITIRNLFAHVPINTFSEELEFDTDERYLHYFMGDLTLKSVSLSSKMFMDNSDTIMQKTIELIDLALDNAKFIQEMVKMLDDLKRSEDKLE